MTNQEWKFEKSLSTYFFSAQGTANPFGETDLKQVFDFNSQEKTLMTTDVDDMVEMSTTSKK